LEFIDDIQRVFPNDTDIATVRNALIQIRKANPKLIIKSFKESVSGPYEKEIEAGDLDFFINKDYGNDIEDDNVILSKIDHLREPVRNMNKEDQDKSMKYIQNLTKLGKLYN
jgi:hypothetical protein